MEFPGAARHPATLSRNVVVMGEQWKWV